MQFGSISFVNHLVLHFFPNSMISHLGDFKIPYYTVLFLLLLVSSPHSGISRLSSRNTTLFIWWSPTAMFGPKHAWPHLICFLQLSQSEQVTTSSTCPYNFFRPLGFPLEKAMALHFSILAWKIPWMEEPGRLQSMGSQRVRHDWATSLPLFTFMHWRRKWQPAPVFLPGESQGQGSLVGCCPWGCTELDRTEVT